MLDGTARQMGLGSQKTVTLSEARETAFHCRKKLRDGIDPIDARNTERGQRRLERVKTMTFAECAERYITAHSPAWQNVKHIMQWRNTLKTYVYPVFGNLPVQHVDTGLVMRAIEPIWLTKTETAGRLRGRIERILDWAGTRKYREGENPARWKGHLEQLLPKRTKIQNVKHHAALPYTEIGAFIDLLRNKDGIAARGLEFLILTAARTGEIIEATWDELDLDDAVWSIPGQRMKNGSLHRVPLSAGAVAIVQAMRTVAQSNYVFPGGKKAKPLSNMAFLKLLKRMGRHDITAHGFRSTFRDWAAERTNYPNEVAEMALAHTVADKVEAAYRRGDLFEKRRRLMNAWESYCSQPTSTRGEIILIKGQNHVSAGSRK